MNTRDPSEAKKIKTDSKFRITDKNPINNRGLASEHMAEKFMNSNLSQILFKVKSDSKLRNNSHDTITTIISRFLRSNCPLYIEKNEYKLRHPRN